MRWDDLFADLEAQADALDRAERSGEVAERTRFELASIGMLDRLRPARGGAVRLQLAGGGFVAGTLERVGVDWVLWLAGTTPADYAHDIGRLVDQVK